ncbi:MAG: efflux RND transporter permease subunit [Planctomycetes bacterium]|nr:efflux RND transporter permease subunit [Planctomycetota bacterium]
MSESEPLLDDHGVPPEENRGLFAWFTQNHVASTLVALTISVAGMVALFGGRVRREVFPEMTPNIVTVQVPYPGASPSEVAQSICLRVEDAVEGVTGVDKITSTASEGAGFIVIETLQEADVDRVLDDVKNRVDAITTFPVDSEEPIVSRLVVRKEVINVSISGDADEATLKHIAEEARDELTALPNISQVDLAAVRPYEISVEVSEDALRRYGLTFDEVANAVRSSSLDLPAGAIKAAEGQTVLRVEGQAYRGTDFAELVLISRPDGTRVLLGDVANVVDGFSEDDILARFDGQPAALLKVFRVGDQDAIAVTDAVKEWVAGPGRRLCPPGVELTTWRDESVILKGRIDLLARNAMNGLVLVLLILALFLQLGTALWVSIGIPIGFFGAVALMPSLDVSVNMISLFAFLLVLGIVVDDAIVVGENIVLHRKPGVSPALASIRGSREVRTPVFASVATTIAAFTPMLFAIPGTDAQIWRVIPCIVIPVLIMSLIESQICLPSHMALMKIRPEGYRPWLGARLFGRVQNGFQRGLDWFVREVYAPTLEVALRFRYATIATALALMILAISTVAAGYPRFVFFPTVEGDNVIVSLTMQQGTPVEVTTARLAAIEGAARAVCAEIDGELGSDADDSVFLHMMSSVGTQPYSAEMARNGGQRDAQFASGSHLAELNVQLAPSERRSVSSDLIMSRMRDRVGTIPDAVELTFTTSFFSTGKDVDIELYHRDGAELALATEDLQRELNAMPEIKDVTSSYRLGKPELELDIKPAAEALGLTQRDLARQVRQAFYGEEAQRVQRGRDDVKVMVRYPESGRRSLRDLEELRIRTPSGDEVPFGEVATLDFGRAYSTVTRVNGKQTLRVSGEIDESDPDASPEAINARLQTEVLPALIDRHPGLGWAFEGDQKKKNDLLRSLAGGYLLALFIIYALMAIPLRSFLQPFMIMTAIPFGVIGAIAGHMITGYDLSILSLFGVVALSGVVVNDNIVLVDWINNRRQHHDTVLAAVRSAGVRRFRPILLTSLTTFGGLSPLLLEKSVQARFLVPMGVSLGFGVIFATFVSLVLVPALYLALEDLRQLAGRTVRGVRWLYGRAPAAEHGGA